MHLANSRFPIILRWYYVNYYVIIILNDKYGQDKNKNKYDDDEYRLHSSATFEEAKAYYNMINLSFYESVEVEIDQQDMRDSQISSVLEN